MVELAFKATLVFGQIGQSVLTLIFFYGTALIGDFVIVHAADGGDVTAAAGAKDLVRLFLGQVDHRPFRLTLGRFEIGSPHDLDATTVVSLLRIILGQRIGTFFNQIRNPVLVDQARKVLRE